MSNKEVIDVWLPYIQSIEDWEEITKGIEPKMSGCGLIYELPNPINRSNESFAIADVRDLKITEPHYHVNDETEVYIILCGNGVVVVGDKELQVEKDSVVITPPNTAHYTIPEKNLVVAVINTPPFQLENYVIVTEDKPQVEFSKNQFNKWASL